MTNLVFHSISLISLLSDQQFGLGGQQIDHLQWCGQRVTFSKYWTSKERSFWHKWPILYNSQMYYSVCLPKIYSETSEYWTLTGLKNISAIEKRPLLGGNLKKIVTFGTKFFVRYS